MHTNSRTLESEVNLSELPIIDRLLAPLVSMMPAKTVLRAVCSFRFGRLKPVSRGLRTRTPFVRMIVTWLFFEDNSNYLMFPAIQTRLEMLFPEKKEVASSDVSNTDEEPIDLDALHPLIKLLFKDERSIRERNNPAEVESLDAMQRQRNAEPRDMRLLGNLARLFINEVVDPIMAMSQEVIADTPDGTAYDRSFCVYLSHVRNYASVLFCEQNPTPYNEMGLRHLRMPYRYNVTERMERVDRALFPVTGVKVLELGLAMDAYHRHTMHHWTCEYSNDEDSLDRFLTECEECEWREEWRDLGTKMTRAVRSKISSNIYQGLKVYCDNPNR